MSGARFVERWFLPEQLATEGRLKRPSVMFKRTPVSQRADRLPKSNYVTFYWFEFAAFSRPADGSPI